MTASAVARRSPIMNPISLLPSMILLESPLIGTVAMHLLLARPVAGQATVGVGIRVIGLVAGLARAIDPCIAVRARHLVNLPGTRVADRLLIAGRCKFRVS